MTDIMKGVISKGTAKGMKWSRSTETEAAGKTGTTNDNKAGWFCGYTPYYTIAVWVGCDIPKTVKNLQGATYPAYIWKSAMLYMIDGLPSEEFDLEGTYSHSTQVKEKKKETPEEETEDNTGDNIEYTDNIDNTDNTNNIDDTQIPSTDIPTDTTQEITGTNGSETTEGGTNGSDPSSTPSNGTDGTTTDPSGGNTDGTGGAGAEGNGTDTSGTQ